jgi:hypothetical protein
MHLDSSSKGIHMLTLCNGQCHQPTNFEMLQAIKHSLLITATSISQHKRTKKRARNHLQSGMNIYDLHYFAIVHYACKYLRTETVVLWRKGMPG